MKPRRRYSIRRLLVLFSALGALVLAVSLVPVAALDWERMLDAQGRQLDPGYQFARALVQERLQAARLLAEQTAGSASPTALPSAQATILLFAADGSLTRSSSGRSLPRLVSLAPTLPAEPLAGVEIDDQGTLVAVGTCPGPEGLTAVTLPFTVEDAQAIKDATGLDGSFLVNGLRLATTLRDRQGETAAGLITPAADWAALLAQPGRLHWTADPNLAEPSYAEVALPLYGLDGTLVAACVAGYPSPGYAALLLQWAWPWLGALVADLAFLGALTAWLGRRLLGPMREARRAIVALANRRDAGGLAGESGLADTDDLVQAVNQLGMDRAALVQVNSQLNERLMRTQHLTSVGQVAMGVAHDLNNPLTTIMGLAEIIHGSIEDADAQRELEVIRRQAERSGRLVRSLLSFARQRAELQWVSLNDLIGQTLDLLAYQARVASIRCELDLSPDLPLTWADPSPLQQVLFNLIQNAIQAMTRGEGRGMLRVQSSWSPPEPGAPYGRIAIRVEDDGPGIPDDVRPHIFRPFFTTKGTAGGTGLGLSSASEIIERHNGRIWAENNPEGGASFFVELPVASEPAAEGVEESERGPHILLADSDPQRIGALAQAVRRRGFWLSTAGDGLSARSKMDQEPFDLVLCAYHLARLDGRELYAWARARHPTLARRFIIITPPSADGEVDAFLQAAHLSALYPPWPEEALEALLNQALVF